MSKMKTASANAEILKPIMPAIQIGLYLGCTPDEEYQFFFDKLEEVAETFSNMPKTYEQDGKGDDAIVYLHYFTGNMDWYITEKDALEEQHQAFGYCDLGMGCPELGYVSLIELAENNIELDLYWTPKTLREVKQSRK